MPDNVLYGSKLRPVEWHNYHTPSTAGTRGGPTARVTKFK